MSNQDRREIVIYVSVIIFLWFVEDVKIISRLGFENKSKGFTEVKGSYEKRNKITGA